MDVLDAGHGGREEGGEKGRMDGDVLESDPRAATVWALCSTRWIFLWEPECHFDAVQKGVTGNG